MQLRNASQIPLRCVGSQSLENSTRAWIHEDTMAEAKDSGNNFIAHGEADES